MGGFGEYLWPFIVPDKKVFSRLQSLNSEGNRENTFLSGNNALIETYNMCSFNIQKGVLTPHVYAHM